jgi:hypothetical protein
MTDPITVTIPLEVSLAEPFRDGLKTIDDKFWEIVSTKKFPFKNIDPSQDISLDGIHIMGYEKYKSILKGSNSLLCQYNTPERVEKLVENVERLPYLGIHELTLFYTYFFNRKRAVKVDDLLRFYNIGCPTDIPIIAAKDTINHLLGMKFIIRMDRGDDNTDYLDRLFRKCPVFSPSEYMILGYRISRIQ